MEIGVEWKDKLLRTLAEVPIRAALAELKGASKHERGRQPARGAKGKVGKARKTAKLSRRRNRRG